MSIVVTVRIPNADVERVRQVDADHPELRAQLIESLQRHGNISHRRLYRDNEIMDIDEWETEEGLRAFLAESGEVIAKLAELRGTGTPSDTIWSVY
ncbi:MAG: hypothetical protein KDB25_00885 [Leucobacter sp.]|nr:hypothetical protein [Leucobacter sp.]